MIGRRGGRGSHQPPNQHDSPNRERDLRDIEVDDLRRQVQQLQQRLEHFEPLEHDVSRHDSENEPTDEENTNPFGRGYDRASNDGNNRRHRHMNNFIRPNFDVKVDIWDVKYMFLNWNGLALFMNSMNVYIMAAEGIFVKLHQWVV
ncbi:hypothetical protein LWI29_035257 [Acer saccharum]|uniref:Uncharacterized protein n=1 Tax=Acer saccharum TaxID=4024 RepID=A0AA39T8C4_ACESA|nr:hypothetical protein LWI29_035257 [Acer saccharum]